MTRKHESGVVSIRAEMGAVEMLCDGCRDNVFVCAAQLFLEESAIGYDPMLQQIGE
jgi:hypothetical protein